jgi:hypothetical protein
VSQIAPRRTLSQFLARPERRRRRRGGSDHGLQGKRPAFGATYMVRKIEEFTNATNTGCWRFLQIVQAFQGFERRRPELLRAAAS